MRTLEQHRAKLKTVTDLNTVVSTMKTLAAARIRQFESVANATQSYWSAVEKALQILLLHPERPKFRFWETDRAGDSGLILLGTDQGFCGKFNSNIADVAEEYVENSSNKGAVRTISLGNRLNELLRSRGIENDATFSLPVSVSGLNRTVQTVLTEIQNWRANRGIESVQLVYHYRKKASPPRIRQHQLLPLSERYLTAVSERDWQSRSLPACSVDWSAAFSSVIQQLLFIQVYRCLAESLASENASRISAMEKAEANIEDKLEDLKHEFHQVRQNVITTELHDIISGYEAS